MKILLIGCGRVGSTIARELLSQEHVVEIVEPNACSVHAKTYKEKWNPQISEVGNYDLHINALPGHLGHSVTKKLVEMGQDVVDISFAPEDYSDIKELADKNNVFCAVDCGIAPGLSNMILGRAEAHSEIESYTCYIGGLPMHPKPPFNYKAGFSPVDVIEEYTRPARFIRDGKIVTKEALSDLEEVGMPCPNKKMAENYKFEAFNTDGLRTMLIGMKTPNIIEKTVRYKGHINLMSAFIEAGFFSDKDVITPYGKVKPIEVSSKLLENHWTFEEGEKDFTSMKAIIKMKNGQTTTFFLIDEYTDGTTSMARTTGYTCTSIVKAYDKGCYFKRKFYTPEEIGKTPAYELVLQELTSKGIKIQAGVNDE